MATTLTLRHARGDDIPVIIGLANQLQWPDSLDTHLGTHALPRGLNNGQLTVGWLAYILSQGDHRKSTVRAWANSLPHPLERLLGQPLREGEFSDDRLRGLLRRLSAEEAWEAIEEDLGAATMVVYELELTGSRLDSPTSSGYHQVTEEGVMQFGPSKDHRPDLPPRKRLAAAAEPSGQLLASAGEPGRGADAPLAPR
jgi:transposase